MCFLLNTFICFAIIPNMLTVLRGGLIIRSSCSFPPSGVYSLENQAAERGKVHKMLLNTSKQNWQNITNLFLEAKESHLLDQNYQQRRVCKVKIHSHNFKGIAKTAPILERQWSPYTLIFKFRKNKIPQDEEANWVNAIQNLYVSNRYQLWNSQILET